MPKKCPHPYGQEVSIPVGQLEIDEATNMRAEQSAASLRTLAASIKAVGQIHPILVLWTGTGYAIVAGFRRALAIIKHTDIKTVRAKVVKSDNPELLRLAENFERESPTTFETCRYVHDLLHGENGRTKIPVDEVAASVGRSRTYVRNLARFYRALPGDVRALWASDRDGAFTFRVLNELATLAASNLGNDDAVRDRVAGVLGLNVSSPDRGDSDAGDDGDEGADGDGAAGGSEPAAGDATGEPAPRKLGKPGAKKLIKRLEAAGPLIVQSDDRATIAVDLLRVFAGELPASRAQQIVEGLLADLGMGGKAAA